MLFTATESDGLYFHFGMDKALPIGSPNAGHSSGAPSDFSSHTLMKITGCKYTFLWNIPMQVKNLPYEAQAIHQQHPKTPSIPLRPQAALETGANLKSILWSDKMSNLF